MPEKMDKIPTSGAAMYNVQKEHDAKETEISVDPTGERLCLLEKSNY